MRASGQVAHNGEMQTTFAIETDGQGLYEFTDRVTRWTSGQGDGLLTLFIRHTSASLLVMENADPEVQTRTSPHIFTASFRQPPIRQCPI